MYNQSAEQLILGFCNRVNSEVVMLFSIYLGGAFKIKCNRKLTIAIFKKKF